MLLQYNTGHCTLPENVNPTRDMSQEDFTDDLEPFRIYSRRQIIFLLENVRAQRQLVKMSASGSTEAVITSILAVEEDESAVWFDAAPSKTLNHKLTSCERIAFETKLDQIRVLFWTETATPGDYQGYPALRVPLPNNIVRIQRREYYRVNIPRTSPILVTVPPPGTTEKPLVQPIIVPMLNISMGGVALIDELDVIDDTLGVTYENCVLALPGGSVTVSLGISNVAHVKLTNGKTVRHIGCRFINLSNAAEAVIQRFILKLERDQNAKMTGFL